MFWLEKDISKVENTLLGLAEYLRKSYVSDNSNVIMADFYEMDFMKCIVILVKTN